MSDHVWPGLILVVGADEMDLAAKEADLLGRVTANGGAVTLEPPPKHFRVYRVEYPTAEPVA